MEVLFSINDFDCDGDLNEKGFFLHFGDTRIKIGESTEALDDLIEQLKSIKKEIEENY